MSDQHSHSAHAHGAHETQPEPQSPMWLPVVGILLFLAAAAYWALATGKAPAEKPASGTGEIGQGTPSTALAQAGAPEAGAQPTRNDGFVPNPRLKEFLDRNLPTH